MWKLFSVALSLKRIRRRKGTNRRLKVRSNDLSSFEMKDEQPLAAFGRCGTECVSKLSYPKIYAKPITINQNPKDKI